MKVASLLILCLVLGACTWNTRRQPSILVIAVEGLNYDSVSCPSENEPTELVGWKIFCEESVRFTHAYTPSLMTQATLASVVTARYPHEHGVWHNGSQFLSAKINTLQEIAVDKGYRTSFFSGGAPIWRKSGLSQGFEVFEDNVPVELNQFYRSSKKNFNLFLRWLDQSVDNSSFFSMIYLTDLQFPEATTVDDLGEARSQNRDGQIKEINESLAYLVDNLKKRKRWNNSYVILMGVNGYSEHGRSRETDSMSLFSDTTQVALFMKPTRKERDTGIEWKIDKNVTLVDVGATLYDVVGTEQPSPPGRQIEVVSLLEVLKRPRVNWDPNRMIVVESGWPLWRGVGNTRFAVRKNQFLLLFDQEVSIYNSLIDRNEVSPMASTDPNWQEVNEEIRAYLVEKGITQWDNPTAGLIEKLQVAKELWRGREPSGELRRRLLHLVKTRSWDLQVAGWQAQQAIDEKNWKRLRVLGAKFQMPIWEFVARANIGETQEINNMSSCALLFADSSFFEEEKRDCKDQLLLKLVRWVRAKNKIERLKHQEEFLKAYRYSLIDLKISKTNYASSLKWHVPLDSPGAPKLADLYLELPQMKSFKKAVLNRFPQGS